MQAVQRPRQHTQWAGQPSGIAQIARLKCPTRHSNTHRRTSCAMHVEDGLIKTMGRNAVLAAVMVVLAVSPSAAWAKPGKEPSRRAEGSDSMVVRNELQRLVETRKGAAGTFKLGTASPYTSPEVGPGPQEADSRKPLELRDFLSPSAAK